MRTWIETDYLFSVKTEILRRYAAHTCLRTVQAE